MSQLKEYKHTVAMTGHCNSYETGDGLMADIQIKDMWKWKDDLTFDKKVECEMALPSWERPSTLKTNLHKVMI